ncbi:hypothetical protein KKH43_01590 [Patescibacteria group bacterium]|nr:hypothetical protein [Patescibacteria group bacterium]
MKRTQKIIISLVAVFTFVVTPLLSTAAPYYNPPYRHDVGLNVHWALGGFGKDELYNQRLFDSKTKWAREHIATEVLTVERPEAWFERYDYVLDQYKKHDIKVVGMLAYGFENGNMQRPNMDEWLAYVDTVVNRYKDSVEVWEVWNEPDSPDFLEPNSPENYVAILSATYDKIKSIDSSAKVMSGGLAQPNVDFTKAVFEQAQGKFDIFGVHYYYAENYVYYGNYDQLERDAKALRDYINTKDPNMPIWVTEYGASTGTAGVTDTVQKNYLEKSSQILLQKGYANRLFVYNIRNYDYNSNYENNFGLLDVNMNPRPSWDWYMRIARGPYDKLRIPIATEQQKASELKTELEKYFGKGLIPISAENWSTVVQAYVYGGYSPQAIAQSIRFGGKTVNPKIAAKFWMQTADYQNYINKDWTGGLITWAYGNPRIKVTDEAKKADDLNTALHTYHDFSKLNITSESWNDLVKAYVYGGYPVSAIARAVVTDWKTVSKTQNYSAWKNTETYKEGAAYQF